MRDKKSDRPTYPELLKFYYVAFPDLSLPAHSIGLALIHKSNELFFPDSFLMSNKELSLLSKVRQSNIGRSRQLLLDRAKLLETPFFTYVSQGTRRAGIYTINFILTSFYLHFNFTLTSNSPKNDKDPNLLNLTKHMDGLGASSEENFNKFTFSEENSNEFRIAEQRLRAYAVNARESLLEEFHPEWINSCIDVFENSYKDHPGKIRDPASIIVSLIRNKKSYESWKTFREQEI